MTLPSDPAPTAVRLTADADARLADVLALTDSHQDATLGEAWKDRRVADVLAHLHAWHVLFLGWLDQSRAGQIPEYPAEGYTWDQLVALNDDLYDRHSASSYATLRGALVETHAASLDAVRALTEAQLTDVGAFPWLPNTTMAVIANECLAAHYDWAAGLMDRAQFA